MTKPIAITRADYNRLQAILTDAQYTDTYQRDALYRLEGELKRATIVDSHAVAPTVVTMQSMVVLHDLDTGEDETLTVVFPEQANLAQGKISVFAPIGMAMLGYAVGDTFVWPVPAGERRMKIKSILYQPEAAGDDL